MRFLLTVIAFSAMLLLTACITVEARDASDTDVADDTADATTETDDADDSVEVDVTVEDEFDDATRDDDEQDDGDTVDVTTEEDDAVREDDDEQDDGTSVDVTTEDEDAARDDDDEQDDVDTLDVTSEDDDAVRDDDQDDSTSVEVTTEDDDAVRDDDDDSLDDSDTADASTEDDEPAADTLEEETTASDDEMYISRMIEHHEAAAAMAEVVLERAERQEILDLAQEIIDTHQAEIAALQDVLDEWYDGGTAGTAATREHGDMPHELDRSDDPRPFDLAYIDEMMSHHEEAIEMSREIIKTTDRDELRDMAEDIISAQESEIDRLQEWRDTWYRK